MARDDPRLAEIRRSTCLCCRSRLWRATAAARLAISGRECRSATSPLEEATVVQDTSTTCPRHVRTGIYPLEDGDWQCADCGTWAFARKPCISRICSEARAAKGQKIPTSQELRSHGICQDFFYTGGCGRPATCTLKHVDGNVERRVARWGGGPGASTLPPAPPPPPPPPGGGEEGRHARVTSIPTELAAGLIGRQGAAISRMQEGYLPTSPHISPHLPTSPHMIGRQGAAISRMQEGCCESSAARAPSPPSVPLSHSGARTHAGGLWRVDQHLKAAARRREPADRHLREQRRGGRRGGHLDRDAADGLARRAGCAGASAATEAEDAYSCLPPRARKHTRTPRRSAVFSRIRCSRTPRTHAVL